jgi:hypothetical protein
LRRGKPHGAAGNSREDHGAWEAALVSPHNAGCFLESVESHRARRDVGEED